jgi:regulator of RNase E activity RraA
MFEDLAPIVGYAATVRIYTSEPPMKGGRFYDRTDWWNHVLTIPAPRIAFVEDADRKPGLGSFVGEVHASILLALGCVGVVTNGAVRDLNALEHKGFQMFAGNVTPSRAYAHIFEFGGPVEIGGLRIEPGDLIHADRHGVLTIPKQIAPEVPAMAERLLQKDREIIEFCRSPEFSLVELQKLIKERAQVTNK